MELKQRRRCCEKLAEGNELAESGQSALENFAEEFLFLGGEFFALRGEIENVDGFLALGVDERDFDVTAETRERRTHFIKQTGMILRGDFEQGAVRGRSVVEVDACFDGDFRRMGFAGAFTALEERVERRFTVYNSSQAGAEAVD